MLHVHVRGTVWVYFFRWANENSVRFQFFREAPVYRGDYRRGRGILVLSLYRYLGYKWLG